MTSYKNTLLDEDYINTLDARNQRYKDDPEIEKYTGFKGP